MPFLILVASLVVLALYHYYFESHVILQFERGIRFYRGRFHSVLEPGKYTFYRPDNAVMRADLRKRNVCVPGQEILTADNVCVKLSVGAVYDIVDHVKALAEVENYQEYLYSLIHGNIRALAADKTADELLSKRNEIAAKMLEMTAPQALSIGLRLHDARVRDLSFPGELKAVFAKVVAAQKESQALVERARGESAALRNLANSAKLLDENPNLMQLRLIQALGQTSGHTVVIGGAQFQPSAGCAGNLSKQGAAETK